ncbi:MAG TPA: hypothetical protein VIO12_02990 [Thermoanaerobaculia bacterium]
MRTRIVAALLLAASIIFYFAGQRKNPPGFFMDESSIGWNALQIARHGVDENSVPFPLFFRAFGEYKNPTYIYLLAAVLKFTGPSNLAARRLSALLGWLACVTIAWLGWRTSRSRFIAGATLLTALFTPMIFEISRLAFEVALYPLATALFLLCVYNASTRERWRARDIALITASLLLLTYTYSIGRLFAPLMTASLFLFYTRERRSQLVTITILFIALAIMPIAAYNAARHGALTLRFHDLSYVNVRQPIVTIVGVEQHYIANLLPLGMALRGDPNSRHHVANSGGSILLMTFVLAGIGAVIALRSRDRWWLFVLIGAALSILPASLTNDQYHTLRMAPYPLFLIALSIPALEWLRTQRLATATILAIGAIQAIWFITIFHRDGGKRVYEFDHGARRAVDTAIAQPARPIYVDPNLYIHALWYGAQHGVEPSAFVFAIPTKPNAVVISGQGTPPVATVLSDAEGWTVYVSR